jgi:hypothetical protein
MPRDLCGAGGGLAGLTATIEHPLMKAGAASRKERHLRFVKERSVEEI